ncbi:MAG: DUF262 domain-containing protein [Clostridiales bacterium]|nr:DUF262 domain-containing protein [Clostridiales bacterium]
MMNDMDRFDKNKEFEEYVKIAEKAEEERSGIEAESEYDTLDSEVDDEDYPYEVKNIRVEQKMITVFQIEHWMQNEILILQPEYQRNLVWDYKRKTALIESMMMKIPIPAFYLDENANGKKYVIDGMQRLSAIHEFMNDGFRLRKMQYLSSSCEKKTFSQLDIKFRSYIEDTVLTVNILDERCPQMVKFDVFRRVNTGGVPLNPQEIRNIMAQPKVRTLLKKMAGCEEFLSATNHKVKDIRMSAQELCLRYLTVRYAYDWEKREFVNYRGLLKMMDASVLRLNNRKEEELEAILKEFQNIMVQCEKVLRTMYFCKPGSNALNKSLFTAWTVVFANRKTESQKLDAYVDQIRKEYNILLEEDSEFYRSITSSTGTKKHIQFSIESVRSIVEGFL